MGPALAAQQNRRDIGELTQLFSRISAANTSLMLQASDANSLWNRLASEGIIHFSRSIEGTKTKALSNAISALKESFSRFCAAHNSLVLALGKNETNNLPALRKEYRERFAQYSSSLRALRSQVQEYDHTSAGKALLGALRLSLEAASVAFVGGIALRAVSMAPSLAAAGTAAAMLAGCRSERKAQQAPATQEEQFLQGYKAEFKKVLSAPSHVPLQRTLNAIDTAHEMLFSTRLERDNGEAVVVARLENNQLSDFTVVCGTRPAEGGAQWHEGNGMRFRVSRLPPFEGVAPGKGGKIERRGGVNYDSGKNYAELRISRSGCEGETWVALAVKLRENYAGKKGDFTITPYCPQLASGEMARFALGYLSSLDSQARTAVGDFGQEIAGECRERHDELEARIAALRAQLKKLHPKKHKAKIRQISGEIAKISQERKTLEYNMNATSEALAQLGRIPKGANTAIALIEAIDMKNLTQDGFCFDVSRFLYNVAANRNQAKLLTVSGACARGLFQFTGATAKNFDAKYGDIPLEIFRRWSVAYGYSPEGWLTRRNRMSDAMYSSVFALFHHADVLSSARYASISENSLYSDSTQTMCAIASGFNGGLNSLRRRISTNSAQGGHNWHQSAFSYGIRNLGEFKKDSNENLGYVVKTPIVLSALAGEKVEPVDLTSNVLPSSHSNSLLALVSQKKKA